MLGYKQVFLIKECRVCSKTKDRWGREEIAPKRFVSHANDPNRFACCSCGYSTILTDGELKKLKGEQEDGE